MKPEILLYSHKITLKETNQCQEPHKKIAAPSLFQVTTGESMFLQGR